MQVDEKIRLAQELARAIAQFWRAGRHKGFHAGIKQSEFMLLAILIHSTDSGSMGIRVSDLSTRLGITSPATTHMINSLEKSGYVERLSDKSDRRLVLVIPTAKGLDLFAAHKEEHIQQLQGLVEFLGEQDAKELVRLLSLIFTYRTEKLSGDEGKPDA